jgi:DNA-nicking Smr family endonuclease
MHADEPPVPLPITGELDLHTFRPGDVSALIPAYLAECRARGIFSVRIVHGKGTGALRGTVHALLRRSPLVQNFQLGNETSGGWGATIAVLKRHERKS